MNINCCDTIWLGDGCTVSLDNASCATMLTAILRVHLLHISDPTDGDDMTRLSHVSSRIKATGTWDAERKQPPPYWPPSPSMIRAA